MSTPTQRLVGSSDQCERQPDDFYETPAIATEELLSREKFPEIIWEPACGSGAISKILEKHNYLVIGSDIRTDNIYGSYPGVDYLKTKQLDKLLNPHSIITNPPFKLALPFILKAVNEPGVEKVAIFGRIQLLESKERYEKLWIKYPPVRIYVFSKRVTCSEEKVSIMCFCWVIWEKGFTGHPELHWIMPGL
jgi:hypothetical protein